MGFRLSPFYAALAHSPCSWSWMKTTINESRSRQFQIIKLAHGLPEAICYILLIILTCRVSNNRTLRLSRGNIPYMVTCVSNSLPMTAVVWKACLPIWRFGWWPAWRGTYVDCYHYRVIQIWTVTVTRISCYNRPVWHGIVMTRNYHIMSW